MAFGLTKEDALERGAALRDMMTHGEWEVSVWENLGWCYDIKLKQGYLRICPSGSREGWPEDQQYFATLATTPNGVGTAEAWSPGRTGIHRADPNDCVALQMVHMYDVLQKTTDVITTVMRGLYPDESPGVDTSERDTLVAEFAKLIAGLAVPYSIQKAMLGTGGPAWLAIRNMLPTIGYTSAEELEALLRKVLFGHAVPA